MSLRVALLFCLPLCLTESLPAQDGDSTPRRMMVMRPDTRLMLDAEVVGKAEQGEILTVTLDQGGWLWVPARDAWVYKDQVQSLSEAKQNLDRTIGKDGSAELLEQRAMLHAAEGRIDEALKDLNKALEKNDKKPSILINRGNAWQESQSYELAVADYTSALRMDAKNVLALTNRAAAYTALKKFKEAEQDIRSALKLDKNHVEAYVNRGVISREQENYKAALDDFTRAIKIEPGHARAYFNRGVVHELRGDDDQALDDYAAAAKLDPRLPQAQNNLAWLLVTSDDEDLRDPERALEAAMQANRLTGFSDWNNLDTLGMANLAAENPELAEKWFKQAKRLAPKSEQKQIDKHLDMVKQAKQKK